MKFKPKHVCNMLKLDVICQLLSNINLSGVVVHLAKRLLQRLRKAQWHNSNKNSYMYYTICFKSFLKGFSCSLFFFKKDVILSSSQCQLCLPCPAEDALSRRTISQNSLLSTEMP